MRSPATMKSAVVAALTDQTRTGVAAIHCIAGFASRAPYACPLVVV
jgi:hypothetical protein